MTSSLNVIFAVAGNHIATWQRKALEAVRAVPGVEVATCTVVPVAGSRPRAPLFGSSACTLEQVAGPSVASLDSADIVINCAGHVNLRTPPLGLWDFKLGNDDDHRFPFAREYAAGTKTLHIALERRIGDAITVLRAGTLPASAWYPSSVYKALHEASRWPAECIAALLAGAALPDEPTTGRNRSPARLSYPQEVAVSLAFAARSVNEIVKATVRDYEWNVGVIEGTPALLLHEAPLKIEWLGEPAAGTWIADPFIVKRGDQCVIYVEKYSESTHKGTIEALVLDEADRVRSRRPSIELDSHLSYPFPLSIGPEFYLLPENSESGSARMYRCIDFPDRWEFDSVILADIDAVDTTLVEHNGLWWAFFTRTSRGRDVSLHAMYSDNPRGPWTSHPLNPVVTDVSRARPAGQFFVVDGALYRPGQDCSRTYGGAVAIARVDELTTTSYRETVVRRLVPDARYPHGLHTVSFSDDRLVIDGKRERVSISLVGRNVRTLVIQIIRMLFRRARMGRS